MLNGGTRRCACATVVAGDQNAVGLGLSDTGSNCADADFGNQLDVDARFDIGILQVVNQLRQILNRVDIVVRRRRDQAHTRSGAACLGDLWQHLVPRELATFTGLSALDDLNLDLVGVDQVITGHAETTGSDLLDGGTAAVAVFVWSETIWVFATFTGVGLAADAVHRNREGFVRF